LIRANEFAATYGIVRLRGQVRLPAQVGIAMACRNFSCRAIGVISS
jgi:hypothetical protein